MFTHPIVNLREPKIPEELKGHPTAQRAYKLQYSRSIESGMNEEDALAAALDVALKHKGES